MPVPVSRLTYGIAAGILVVFAICSTGLASNILIRFTDDFPSSKVGSLTRLAEFGSVWNLFFGVVYSVGLLTYAEWASPFIGAVVFFIGFLVNIVAAGTFSQRDRITGFSSGADEGMAGVAKNLKALEAFLWLGVFSSLYLTLYLFYKNTQSDKEPTKKESA